MKTKLKLSVKPLLILLLLNSNALWCQNESNDLFVNHELKLNALTTLGGYFEGSYDYIINDESSAGISVGFAFDDDVEYNFMVIPNYRFFFGNKPAAGFFIEANMAIYSQKEQGGSFLGTSNIPNGDNYMGFGAGLVIGGKFISTKSGFVGELFVGGGRNFINTDNIDSGYPRVGISIGKRF